jgi:protein involved in polysaccharide export with SLBB domain
MAALCGSALYAQSYPPFNTGSLGQATTSTPSTPSTSSSDDSLIFTTETPQEAASADKIIQVLQNDPVLLEEVKRIGAEQLRSRGFAVDESQITDSVLFDRIRTDSNLRMVLTQYLVQKGALDKNDLGTPMLATRPEDNTLGTNRNAPELARPRRPAPQLIEPRESTEKNGEEPKEPGESRAETKSVNVPYSKMPALDDLYRQFRKNDTNLQRFGADLFNDTHNQDANQVMDLPAGPDYVLGPGDGLTIILSGGVSQSLRQTVDREGRVVLPEVGAIVVAGKSLSQAQQSIEQAISTQYRNTRVDLSLARLRSVRVYVVGDVARPGGYDISSLSTPLNALIAAGGPTPRGSMRSIKHYRSNRVIAQVDLYDFMLKGLREDGQRLLPGDTILVPPVGPQVTVNGMVRRPAIYELRGETSLENVLDLAGGVLVSGALRQIDVERIEAHEKRTMISLRSPASATDEQVNQQLAGFKVQDGDKIAIAPILPYSDQAVYLDGHVVRPGKYAYQKGMMLTDLITSYEVLLPEPSDHGEIIRLMPPDFRPTTIEFNVSHALAGDEPIALKPFDTVRIYGRYEIDAPKVAIYGEVLRPGEYPLTPGTTAASLVRLAGGFKRSAETQTADLSTYVTDGEDKISITHKTLDITKAMSGDTAADAPLKPGDVLSIHQISGWNEIGASVKVTGEVAHPGNYGIQQGEKLSSVLERAGGFREGAYPAGAVFSRVEVKQLDERSRQALIQRIQGAQPKISTPEGAVLSSAFAQQQQQMLLRLKNQPSNGRLVIRISSDIAKWRNTPADIELRAGDTLHIPKQPGFVLVNGQVNNASALTFTPGKNAGWYLERAGGVTDFGNRKGIFVIRADGSVVGKNGTSSWFSGNVLSTVMHPGDTVVVPDKIITENAFWKNLLNTAQITSSLFVAAKVATSF